MTCAHFVLTAASAIFSEPIPCCRYCRRIRGSHWGSDIEIQALCKVTGHSVQVYSAERIIWCSIRLGIANLPCLLLMPPPGSIPTSTRKRSSRLKTLMWDCGRVNRRETLLLVTPMQSSINGQKHPTPAPQKNILLTIQSRLGALCP